MEEQRANARQSADDRNTETAEAKVKAIFMDLYNYFRMDSSMDPIVLFEQLCCVLIQLQSRTDLHSFGGIEDDPTARYYGLMEQFQLSAVGRRVTTEPFMMRDQPKLIRRLMNAADGAVELIRDGRGLVPPLFDFLDTILQERRGETVGTPLQTAREIVKLVHQSDQMSLISAALDPACGSGAFLLALLEQSEVHPTLIFSKMEGLERDEHLRNCVMLMACFYDCFNFITITVTDGGAPVQIKEGAYDLILANPPFYTQSLRDRDILDDSHELPVPTKDTHRAFLQRILLGLKTGGESAIIVPDSFLARTDPDAIRVRRWIVEEFQCKGVVKLPAYTFYSKTPVNASVLFLRKPPAYEREFREEGIFFFTVEVDGRSNDTRRLPVQRNDFDELRQVWNQRDALWREWCGEVHALDGHNMDVPVQWDHPHFWFGSLENVRRGDYSLLPEQYRPVRPSAGPIQDPEQILEEIQKLGREIMELTQQLAEAEYDG